MNVRHSVLSETSVTAPAYRGAASIQKDGHGENLKLENGNPKNLNPDLNSWDFHSPTSNFPRVRPSCLEGGPMRKVIFFIALCASVAQARQASPDWSAWKPVTGQTDIDYRVKTDTGAANGYGAPHSIQFRNHSAN